MILYKTRVSDKLEWEGGINESTNTFPTLQIHDQNAITVSVNIWSYFLKAPSYTNPKVISIGPMLTPASLSLITTDSTLIK
jgi:hypothetical protein